MPMDKPIRKPRGPLTWLSSRTWRFWVAVAIAVPVLYVGSWPPVLRLYFIGVLPQRIIPIWQPADMLCAAAPEQLATPIRWWFDLCLIGIETEETEPEPNP